MIKFNLYKGGTINELFIRLSFGLSISFVICIGHSIKEK